MTSDVIINEAICFLANNFQKSTNIAIKAVMEEFYSELEIVAAKKLLHKYMSDNCNIKDELPRLINRQGTNRHTMNTDDFVKLFTLVDERKLSDRLPTFVAANLSKIPALDMEESSNITLARRMVTLETQVAKVLECFTSQQAISQQNQNSCALTSTEKSLKTHLTSADQACLELERRNEIVTALVNNADPNVGLITESGESIRTANSNVSTKNKKDKLSYSNVVQNKDDDGFKPVSYKRKQSKKFVASGNNISTDVVAAIKIEKKFVFHVDNLSKTCTEGSLTTFLNDNNVEVLSLYPAKSWMSALKRDKVAAFRVCVRSSCKNIVMSNIWSDSVTLRPWKFKNTTANMLPSDENNS